MSSATAFNVDDILSAVSDWRLITNKATSKEATPDEILLGLRNPDRNSRVRIAWSFVRHQRRERSVMQRIADDRIRNVRRIIADYPPTPIPVLRQLSQDQSADVRRQVACHPHLNRELQTALARDRDREVQRNIASGGGTLTDLVKELSRSPDHWTRCLIADRSHLPHDVMLQLATDPIATVRSRLAKNLTPPDISLILAGDRNHEVAYPIAIRHHLSVEEIRLLATHRSEHIKMTIAERTDLPHDVTRRLAKDQSPLVRQRIAAVTSDPTLLKKLATDPGFEVQRTVLTNPSSTLDVLKKVTRLRSERMRSALVQHPNATPELIEPYLSAYEPSLRLTARNAYLRLTGLPFPAGREHIDGSPQTDPAVIYSLLDGHGAKDSVWPAASNTNLPLSVRIAILRSPEVPIEQLRANAHDRRAEVRIAIAERSDVPEDLLAHFMTDRSGNIRELANAEYRRRYAQGQRP